MDPEGAKQRHAKEAGDEPPPSLSPAPPDKPVAPPASRDATSPPHPCGTPSCANYVCPLPDHECVSCEWMVTVPTGGGIAKTPQDGGPQEPGGGGHKYATPDAPPPVGPGEKRTETPPDVVPPQKSPCPPEFAAAMARLDAAADECRALANAAAGLMNAALGGSAGAATAAPRSRLGRALAALGADASSDAARSAGEGVSPGEALVAMFPAVNSAVQCGAALATSRAGLARRFGGVCPEEVAAIAVSPDEAQAWSDLASGAGGGVPDGELAAWLGDDVIPAVTATLESVMRAAFLRAGMSREDAARLAAGAAEKARALMTAAMTKDRVRQLRHMARELAALSRAWDNSPALFETFLGATPLGPILDAINTAAAFRAMAANPSLGNAANLVLEGIAWIPGVGDAVKAVFKKIGKVLGEIGQALKGVWDAIRGKKPPARVAVRVARVSARNAAATLAAAQRRAREQVRREARVAADKRRRGVLMPGGGGGVRPGEKHGGLTERPGAPRPVRSEAERRTTDQVPVGPTQPPRMPTPEVPGASRPIHDPPPQGGGPPPVGPGATQPTGGAGTPPGSTPPGATPQPSGSGPAPGASPSGGTPPAAAEGPSRAGAELDGAAAAAAERRRRGAGATSDKYPATEPEPTDPPSGPTTQGPPDTVPPQGGGAERPSGTSGAPGMPDGPPAPPPKPTATPEGSGARAGEDSGKRSTSEEPGAGGRYAERVQSWLDQQRGIPERGTGEWADYQRRVCGDMKYELPAPPGEKVVCDGVRPSSGSILDSKYVGDPANSPYRLDPNLRQDIADKIHAKTIDEFRRYSQVLKSGSTPLRELEVITNDPGAVPFFESLMRRFEIPGRVVVR